LAAVIALFVVGAILKPDTFPTWANVRNMLTQASVVGVLAMGMTFVIATAGIDLSVGSMVAAAGMFAGVLIGDTGTSSLLFIVGAIAFGTLLGTVNATSIAFGRVVPFIATLAMFSIGRGIALLFNHKLPVSLLDLNGGSFGDPRVLAALVRDRAHPRDSGVGLRIPGDHDRGLDAAQPDALRPLRRRGRR